MRPHPDGTAASSARAALVEGPRGLPLIGDALSFMRSPLRYMEALHRTGDFVRVRLAGLDVFQCTDPELVEQVLVTSAKSFGRDLFLLSLRELLGEGLLTSEGDFWLRQRRLSQPAFHRDRIHAYGRMMAERARHFADTLPLDTELDVHARFMELTLDIVARALFSADVSAHIPTVTTAMEVFTARYASKLLMALPRLARLPIWPASRRFAEQVRALDRVLYALIEQRHKSSGDDLLGLLLAARDEDGSRMSDEHVRDEVVTLFLAGHETTALALTFSLLLLSRHPEAEAALVAELREVLGDRPPEPEDLPRLRFTEAVVLEGLRLYPPAWSLGRSVRSPVSLGGVTLLPGQTVWLSPWVMHRDARWFPEPQRFRPERWLQGESGGSGGSGGEGLRRRLPRCAYLPFGAGQRMCIGHSFAMTEAVLVLATWAQRFRFLVREPRRLELLTSVTLRPKGGLRARIERR
jgi:cytochrome P450